MSGLGADGFSDASARQDWKEPTLQDRVQCFFESLGSPTGCRHEDYHQQRGTGSLEGLHSNWVTDSILACARPSEDMLDAGLAAQFLESGIQAIVNLQEKGEHPWCGPGIVSSGFSYDPRRFASSGVAFHHFPWQDMGCPSFHVMMSICQIMKDVVSAGGKVAIHCHAGLGRTGLVAACFLVHYDSMPATEAIALVRANRPGSVQTIQQATYVQEFEEFNSPSGNGDLVPLLPLRTDATGYKRPLFSRLLLFCKTAAWVCCEGVFYVLSFFWPLTAIKPSRSDRFGRDPSTSSRPNSQSPPR